MKKNTHQTTISSKLSRITLGGLFGLVLTSVLFIQPASASEITSENIINLINTKRQAYNLPVFKVDDQLNLAAIFKSKDMIRRDYFDHYGYGLSPWLFILNAGYRYSVAGENLAMDFATSEGVVNAWMNSPQHRDNILSEDFVDVGVGVVKGVYSEGGKEHETYMVTNMLGRRLNIFQRTLNQLKDWLW